MKVLRNLTACTLLLSTSLLSATETGQYIKEAEAYLKKGEAKAAVIQLKNALQENPSSIEARLMLGKIYLQAGDGPSAEKEFERAKKLNAAKSYWELDLAQAYLMQGKFQEILDNIQEDPRSDVENRVTIWLLRGDAHLGLRQYLEARSAYNEAKQLQPESQKSMIGLVMVDVAENNRPEALNKLDTLLTTYPDNTTALVLRGELNMQTGGTELALADYNRALELQPDNVQGLLGRAQINLAGGKLELAKKDVEKLQTLAPGHPKLLHLSGAIALLEKDLDKAETLLQKALNADPNNLQTQTLLGAVNFYKGNLEAAHEYLSQVLKARPGLLPAIKMLASVQHKLKQFDAVVKLLEPAYRQYPSDPQLMAMLGTAYMQVKRFQEGSDLMSRAIEISPNLAAYRTQLALGLLAQGKNSEAIEQLENTIDIDKDFVQADILLVLSHLNKKDYDKALEASQAMEKRMPDNPIGYNLSGLAYMMSGKMEQAEQRFEKALEIDPNFTTAEANLARMALQRNDVNQARSHYESALKKSPKNANLLIGLAELARRDGDAERMHELLEQAQNGEPKTTRPGLIAAQAYLAEKQPLKALRTTSQLAADFPGHPAVLLIHGKAQLAAGDAINAVTTFRKLTEQQKNAETLQLLGNAQQAAEQPDAARESYQQALEEKPGYVPALIGLFSLELKAGHHELALNHAKSIQQALPDNPTGFEFEGTVLAVQGKVKPSIDLYNKAYTLQPSERLAIPLAQQYVRAGQTQRGLDLLKEWAEKPSDTQIARINLAGMQLAQGEHDAAIQTYEKVLQADSKNLVTLNNLAWLYSTRGDKRAVDLGKRAYELAPTRSEIVDTYGWILVQTGDIQEGLNILKQAAELNPKHQEIIYHLGYALNKQGDSRAAKSQLQRAIALDENSKMAQTARELLKSIH
ncbi:XrtA/PEP-CTERM system TPR-repeat protein PrsT [Sedimenticola sp.]|uniref:XrtA/PEP-CTERM system TPR-repeat protein PrsT n=1 Tax=Sedimenticola sp. TaxID=1940285 RepID=UPI003D11F0AA